MRHTWPWPSGAGRADRPSRMRHPGASCGEQRSEPRAEVWTPQGHGAVSKVPARASCSTQPMR